MLPEHGIVQYWHVDLGTPITNADYGAGCVDLNGNAGIIGAPVIDPVSEMLHVVNSLAFQLGELACEYRFTDSDGRRVPPFRVVESFENMVKKFEKR
jgi:hypothetical protein